MLYLLYGLVWWICIGLFSVCVSLQNLAGFWCSSSSAFFRCSMITEWRRREEAYSSVKISREKQKLLLSWAPSSLPNFSGLQRIKYLSNSLDLQNCFFAFGRIEIRRQGTCFIFSLTYPLVFVFSSLCHEEGCPRASIVKSCISLPQSELALQNGQAIWTILPGGKEDISQATELDQS